MKRPFAKPPISIQKQVELLSNRGMLIQDTALAEQSLAQINYYRLRAYWLPFEANNINHQFQNNTSFEQVLNVYEFDRELRLLLLDVIERVEVSFRSHFALALSHTHGTHPHLNSGLFKSAQHGWDYQQAVQQLIQEVTKNKETFIKHFSQNYTEPLPPIWALVEIMTLGQISKWYDNLSASQDRNTISRAFGLDETIMVSFMHHLSTIRNLCAHHSRIWNRSYKFTYKIPKRSHASLDNSINQFTPKQIYNTLVMLKFLLDQICPGHDWDKRLKVLLKQHTIETSLMGFPNDWQDKQLWQ